VGLRGALVRSCIGGDALVSARARSVRNARCARTHTISTHTHTRIRIHAQIHTAEAEVMMIETYVS
jgi:hypothetical protein